jgi:hypothetical protein
MWTFRQPDQAARRNNDVTIIQRHRFGRGNTGPLVFLSSHLLAYTSMKPSSEYHLRSSWCSCPTSPPTVVPNPSHRNRAPVFALRRSTGRSAEMSPSFYQRACSQIPPWSLAQMSPLTILVLMLQMHAPTHSHPSTQTETLRNPRT